MLCEKQPHLFLDAAVSISEHDNSDLYVFLYADSLGFK